MSTIQPEALRLADMLDSDYDPDWFYEIGVDEVVKELRRLHAENSSLKVVFDEWIAKTEWVQKSLKPRELGKHRADILHARIADLEAQLASIGAGGVSPLLGAAGDAGWRAQFDDWWRRNRVATHQVKSIGGFSAKVWHAAIQTVVGATDSTAGFYPADEGSTPSRQAAAPSSAKGVAHG